MVQQIGQRISLANQLKVMPLNHMASTGTHHFSGVVGAVIRHQPDINEAGGIGLRLNRVDEIADDVLLVARGDQHGITVGHGRVGETHGLGKQGHHNAQSLIHHARSTDDHQ